MTGLVDGLHVFVITSNDLAGHVSGIATTVFTVDTSVTDTTAPVIPSVIFP
jgi:TctA family transporter